MSGFVEDHKDACKMPRDVPLLVLVLFVVSLNHVASKSATSSYYEHRRRLLHHIQMSSLNSSSKETPTGPKIASASTHAVDQITHYCGYKSRETAYAGAIATFGVYSFPNLKKRQSTATQIWVGNRNTEVISGWEIDPEVYGDSQTHFFIYWTANGKDGCRNLDCVGFVPVNKATITPGDTLKPSSGQLSITVKIFKSKEDGDWWLHFGHDINNLSPVGYWPKTILISMQDDANKIQWGGTTASYDGDISPPMGNGQWPRSNSAASFRHVQFVDTNGHGYDPPMGSLQATETHKNCYRTGVFKLQVEGNMFYYGGPGGCTN